MAGDERAWIALQQRLNEVLGPEHAVTLIARLPDPASALATRADIDALGTRMDRLEDRMDRLEDRMDRLEHRMDDLQREVRHHTRTFTLAVIGSIATSSTIAFAAASIV